MREQIKELRDECLERAGEIEKENPESTASVWTYRHCAEKLDAILAEPEGVVFDDCLVEDYPIDNVGRCGRVGIISEKLVKFINKEVIVEIREKQA